MAKYSAYGTKLKRNGTDVAQILSLSGPSMSADTADVTEHDGDGWEEVIVTVLRSGEVTFEIAYDPDETTHKNSSGGLLHDFTTRTSATWSVVLPSTPAKTISFTGFVTGFEVSAPVDDALKASVTIKPTGQLTLP